MARKRKTETSQKPIEQYDHKDKQRLNNPPVGLVDARTDNGGQKKKTYQYDPHLDPQLSFDHTHAELHQSAIENFQQLKERINGLQKCITEFENTLHKEEFKKVKTTLNKEQQALNEELKTLEATHLPGLVWAGKAEHTSFEVPTVSLHVHERIDPRRIIETVQKEDNSPRQISLFEEHKKPLREAIEFYKHKEDWSNRLIAGDSLLVMNSLLEKEGMGGKVQMVYFDPPYGIKYGSNFQPFVNKRDVKDGKDEDLTAEPEMIKAFRDTWELGIHSYLTYLRDRLLLACDLLNESGSVFVQIGDENLHLVRNILDELFGVENFITVISLKKSGSQTTGLIPTVCDYILWYAKDKTKTKYRQIFLRKEIGIDETEFNQLINEKGEYRSLTSDEKASKQIPKGFKIFKSTDLNSRSGSETTSKPYTFQGKEYFPRSGAGWRTNLAGLSRLEKQKRLIATSNTLRYVHYFDDFPFSQLSNIWDDMMGAANLIYVVQTNEKAIQRCLLMTTDPGDLLLDITCGSGTTSYVAENWGRRWITCDTSRVAITLAKQRLMTAVFDYYELAHPHEGVGSGFKYKTVPHITLKSIANNEPPAQETLYDQPFVDSKRLRVTGPFTVEAVPAPVVKTMEETESDASTEADKSVSRSGETLRQNEWRDELLRAGVRAKGGKLIEFTRMETARGLRYAQAEGETKEAKPKKVYVVFGPEHAPLEQRTVELAWEEVKPYKPDIILYCALQFDEEAAKDIDEMNPEITKCLFLKAQMNADLLTDDLKKKRSSNESFWLIGQPDVILRKVSPSGGGKGEEHYQVEVHGFDYYNPKTGRVDSGGKGDIAMWMLDHDYDGRSLFPSQVFFPMAGDKEGWATIAKNLKAEIDEEKVEAFKGTVSLPFTPGKAVAVKIIDARGIESLKIIRL